MPFPNIPIELFENVLSYLAQPDLFALSQVSKGFNGAMVPRLYSHMILKVDLMNFAPVRDSMPNYEIWLEALQGLVSNTQNQCHWIQKLTICGECTFGENKANDLGPYANFVSRSTGIQGPVPVLVNNVLGVAVRQMANLTELEWLSGFRPSDSLFNALLSLPLTSISFNAGLMLCRYKLSSLFKRAPFDFRGANLSKLQSLHFFNIHDLDSIDTICRVILSVRYQLKELSLHFSRPLPMDETFETPIADILPPLLRELLESGQPLRLQHLGIYGCGETDLASLFQAIDFSTIQSFSFVAGSPVNLYLWDNLRSRRVALTTLMTDQPGEGIYHYLQSFGGMRRLFLQYLSADLRVSQLCVQHWHTLRTLFLPPGNQTMHNVQAAASSCPNLEELGLVAYSDHLYELFEILETCHKLKSLFIYNNFKDPDQRELGPLLSPKAFIKKFVEYFARAPRRRKRGFFSTFYHGLEKITFHDALWVMMPTNEEIVKGSLYDYISHQHHPKHLKPHDTHVITAIHGTNHGVLAEARGRGVNRLPVRVSWDRYRDNETIKRLIDYLIDRNPGRNLYPYVSTNLLVEPRLRYL
ncbi:hypothetical protein LOZ12_003990 [Ophidiomyces ophidiicola]|uniref:uncharacterized protein n=1 Tax=Ophidiomyces ophidiicola TaxID=1387563 RepID=UPI0020C3D171|nr:uncharacterized protein LOZ57_002657 [Ophidiomyces ophidiicola]KAI1913654.1 hypothetical protein LOZ64_004085 [Ophidiomyces ophidiicola]KAI1949283.1 hypothetical protein LOZ57_002657 [Ophidiomyces ophidiicola]KAI2029241.1 hypothetical protein LOZ48_003756 [Ophidiomyces ophidiicola]KAI2112942.1 hypothetical protein LOZ32_005742 [Ophidiomyces ophidiicola]KAI2156240.1 hypothetical protein LOZ25_004196 [Ophidiomyces ophidiicola]